MDGRSLLFIIKTRQFCGSECKKIHFNSIPLLSVSTIWMSFENITKHKIIKIKMRVGWFTENERLFRCPSCHALSDCFVCEGESHWCEFNFRGIRFFLRRRRRLHLNRNFSSEEHFVDNLWRSKCLLRIMETIGAF